MTDDPFAPPDPQGPPGSQPPPYWAGQARAPWTPAPWGPPGSGPWGAPGSPAPDAPYSWDAPPDPGWNVVRPIDPFQTLMYRRKRGLWYGLAALGLALLIPPAAVIGVVMLIVGVGFLVLLGVVVAAVVVAVWASMSLTMLGRNRVDTASDALWMLPAIAALGLLAYYVLWFLTNTQGGTVLSPGSLA